ncbi:MAG TPA: glycosyltransferase family 39 protein [Tepidisphaeraceae bacterium]|nr:glycosyltransferase family 39 protein [Tepidisphaeraceae bacterium]
MDEQVAQPSSWRQSVVVILLTAAALAATLPMLEFASGSENLVVSTALETRRESHWLMPTLEGELRIAKPPLATWLTAAAISPSLSRDLSSADSATRERAHWHLRWRARLPSLLTACGLLVACGAFARVFVGAREAWIAVAICASTIMFLKAARSATTDIQLALWVAAANALLAQALFASRRRALVALAGVAVGLALMSKGPVTLLQTVLPLALFAMWDRLTKPASEVLSSKSFTWIASCAFGIGLMLCVALPWYVAIYLRDPGVASVWWREVTREGATGIAPGKWYNYVVLLPILLPWTVAFVLGTTRISLNLIARTRVDRRMVLAMAYVLVPIIVMSFFRDRKERYLLPMVVPAAVVAAYGLQSLLNPLEPRKRLFQALRRLHWIGLLAAAVGLPVAGLVFLKSIEGRPWFSWSEAMLLGLAAGVPALWGLANSGLRASRFVWPTLATMLVLQVGLVWGYRHAREGRSEMKPLADLIWKSYPEADVYTSSEGRKKYAPNDLAIYLNRAVRWSSSPGEVPQHARPTVLVIRQDEDELEPPPTPPGWAHFAKVPRDKSWWHAFVRQDPAPLPAEDR